MAGYREGVVGLLPEADQFQSLARRLGVSDNTHVVVVPAGVSSTDFGMPKPIGHLKCLAKQHRFWMAAFPRGVISLQPK